MIQERTIWREEGGDVLIVTPGRQDMWACGSKVSFQGSWWQIRQYMSGPFVTTYWLQKLPPVFNPSPHIPTTYWPARHIPTP